MCSLVRHQHLPTRCWLQAELLTSLVHSAHEQMPVPWLQDKVLAQLEKEGKSAKPKKAAAKPSPAASKAGDVKAAGGKV